MEELIWKYLDGQCDAKELTQIAELRQNPEFILAYEEAKALHGLLGKSMLLKTTAGFEQAVMNKVNEQILYQPSTNVAHLTPAIYPVAFKIPLLIWVIPFVIFLSAIFLRLSFTSGGMSPNPGQDYISALSHSFSGLFANINTQGFLYFSLLSLIFPLLYWADKGIQLTIKKLVLRKFFS